MTTRHAHRDVDFVCDVKPPKFVVAMLNPIMRVVLRTSAGRLVKSLALLEFTTRHSKRCLRVPVGWHVSSEGPVVFTPAPWRSNFTGGLAATVYQRGERRALLGVLEPDPHAVAATLGNLLAAGMSARSVGLKIPRGHKPDAKDMIEVNRAMIRFRSLDGVSP
jgi:hypothetical protein